MKIDEMTQIVRAGTTMTQEEAREKVDAIIATIRREVETDGRSQVAGLGTFKRKRRVARVVKSQFTRRDAVNVPERDTVVFRPAQNWKTALA